MGEQLHATLAGGCRTRGLRLLHTCLRSRQESSADVVGDIAVKRFVGPIESELPGRRCEHEIHFQALLHTRASARDRWCVYSALLPLLRGGWVAGDVPAAVEYASSP